MPARRGDGRPPSLVRVPASSANLGPGLRRDGRGALPAPGAGGGGGRASSLETGRPRRPARRDNLVVRAFESLHPADGIAFRLRSEIPLAGGLGSSAAAIVAGLFAADHLFELATPRDAGPGDRAGGPPRQRRRGDLRRVRDLRSGRGRAAAASIRRAASRRCVVIPAEEVSTERARRRSRPRCRWDAVANVAAASQLVLGLEPATSTSSPAASPTASTSPAAAHLYPRSMELVDSAAELGALGATISGAGPDRPRLDHLAGHRQGGRGAGAPLRGLGRGPPPPLHPHGADVPEL